MSMQDDQRQRYQERAGLSSEQLDQAIGGFAVSDVNVRANVQFAVESEAESVQAQEAVRRLVADAATIGAKYNQAAKMMDRDARQVLDRDEVANDRALLEQMFADEYRFTDPFGNVGDKHKTIDTILSGKIRFRTFGRGGFETTEDTLQVHGNTAVSRGTFTMSGVQRAENVRTGEVEERSRSGTYRTTHTYIYRDGRWQLVASQMTQVPPERDWVFVDD